MGSRFQLDLSYLFTYLNSDVTFLNFPHTKLKKQPRKVGAGSSQILHAISPLFIHSQPSFVARLWGPRTSPLLLMVSPFRACCAATVSGSGLALHLGHGILPLDDQDPSLPRLPANRQFLTRLGC